jgi:hypothetical protein
MRRFAAALLTAYPLTALLMGASPATAAVPVWVTAGECTDAGGAIVPVGRGKAICRGGMWDNELVHAD